MPDNNSPHDIFISYSRKNKDMVLPIKEVIEQTLGLRCWIDLSDIPCGAENFKKKVIPGIRQTRIAFLFFLSAESQASEYAIKEIGFASKRANKRVVLVRINDDDMTDDFFFDFQNADIIDWRVPEQKEKLLRDLRAWADKVNEFDEPPPPDASLSSSAESVKKQPEVSFVTCPICGKKNKIEDTFRCRECGRESLCIRHQDEKTYLCCECKVSAGSVNSVAVSGKNIRREKRKQERPIQREWGVASNCSCGMVALSSGNKTTGEIRLSRLDATQNAPKKVPAKVADDDRDAEVALAIAVALACGDAHKKVQLWEGGPYWADTNIGAERPYEFGYYFWWGDTVGYKREMASGWINRWFSSNKEVWVARDGSSTGFKFDDAHAPTCGKNPFSLHNSGWITAGGVLASEYDAAQVQWGGRWRMPTVQELKDLRAKCDWMWSTMNGVNGYAVRGRYDYASYSIFLPCAGYGCGTSLSNAGSYGN